MLCALALIIPNSAHYKGTYAIIYENIYKNIYAKNLRKESTQG